MSGPMQGPLGASDDFRQPELTSGSNDGFRPPLITEGRSGHGSNTKR